MTNPAWKFECFKNVVIDLIENRDSRPAGKFIPEEVDKEKDTQYFVDTYQCSTPMVDRFIITRFTIYETENKIVVEYENMRTGFGGGAVVGYDYDGTAVKYAHMFNAFLG